MWGWILAASGITRERSTGEKLNLRAKCFASAMIWMWNTIENYDVGRIQIAKEFADVWTFDKGNADNYGLHFSNQFYFPQSTEKVLIKTVSLSFLWERIKIE